MVELLNILLFVTRNLAALAIAAALAVWLCPRGSFASLRWMVTLALYVVVAALSTLLLGVLGHLRTGYALVLLLPTAAIAGYYLYRTASLKLFVPQAPAWDEIRRASPLLALTAGLGFIWFVKYTLGGTFLTFDDKTYHASNAAYWLLSGKVSLTSFSYQSYYSLNGELFSTWLMMPFFTDAAVPVSGLVFAAIFLLTSLTLGEHWRLPPWVRYVPVFLYLCSTEIMGQSDWFSDIDIGAPVMLMAAFAVGTVRQAVPSQEPANAASYRRLALAGLLAGFSVGMKVNMAPLAAACFLYLVLSDARLRRLPQALIAGMLFTFSAMLTGGFYYLRNWILTGSPLFPAAIGPFEGPFSLVDQAETTLFYSLRHGEFGPAEWRGLYEAVFEWPVSHALIALGAIVFVATRCWIRRDCNALVRSLFLSSLLYIALIPMQPFSARGDDGLFYVEGSSRYLTFVYLSGFLLLAWCLRPWKNPPFSDRLAKRLGLLAVLLVLFVLPFFIERKSMAVVGGLTMTAVAFAFIEWPPWRPLASRFQRWNGTHAALPLGVTGVLAYVAAVAPINLTATDETHISRWLYDEIERLPEGSRLAMYMDLRPEIYSLYGRRLQHQPVRLLGDGRPSPPLHERHNRDEYRSFFDYSYDIRQAAAKPEPEELIRNAREAGVDFIITLTITHRERDWPIQHYLLQQTGLPIYGQSEDAVIWDLRDMVVDGKHTK